jgi:uncharacterized protein YicC (UPF0701 family)
MRISSTAVGDFDVAKVEVTKRGGVRIVTTMADDDDAADTIVLDPETAQAVADVSKQSTASQTVRCVRVVDFVAESLHQIAQHSSSGEDLHKMADAVAALKDTSVVNVVEENKSEPSVYSKRGIIFLD